MYRRSFPFFAFYVYLPPRVSGFGPGVSVKTFAVEKRLRGHVFQLNLSNSLGTTMMVMDLSRKFF